MTSPAATHRAAAIELARVRAAQITPAQVVRRWNDDRFVKPAEIDPRLLSRTVSGQRILPKYGRFQLPTRGHLSSPLAAMMTGCDRATEPSGMRETN